MFFMAVLRGFGVEVRGGVHPVRRPQPAVFAAPDGGIFLIASGHRAAGEPLAAERLPPPDSACRACCPRISGLRGFRRDADQHGATWDAVGRLCAGAWRGAERPRDRRYLSRWWASARTASTLKTCCRCLVGVTLVNIFNIHDASASFTIIAALFGTTLAPIAGRYGVFAGRARGVFAHVAGHQRRLPARGDEPVQQRLFRRVRGRAALPAA